MLTPTNQPSKVYKSREDRPIITPPCPEDEIYAYPSKFLPDTENICWRFRVQEEHKRMGKRKISNVIECYKETIPKEIFALSTRERRAELCNEKRMMEVYILDTHAKRKRDINEIFSNFSEPPDIENVLEKDGHVSLYGFKEYRDYISIEQYMKLLFKEYPDYRDIVGTEKIETIKVCLADPFTTYILKNLQEKEYFMLLSNEETTYRPENPVYLMSYKQLKILLGGDAKIHTYNHDDIRINNEEDVKVIKTILANWKELQRLEQQKLTRMEEVFIINTKPTPVTELEAGEYIAYKYLKRMFRGRTQIIVYIKRNDETETPSLGSWLTHELEKIDLTKTLAPINILIGGNRKAVTSNYTDRYTTVTSSQVE